MGAVKEWAFIHFECVVCGRNFLPWKTTHKMNDMRIPTCSQQCDDETKDVFEHIADTQEVHMDEENKKTEEQPQPESMEEAVDKIWEMGKSLAQSLPEERKQKIMSSIITKHIDDFAKTLNHTFNLFGMYAAENRVGLAIGNTLFDVQVKVEQFETEAALNDRMAVLREKHHTEVDEIQKEKGGTTIKE